MKRICGLCLCVFILFSITRSPSAQGKWMPDTNLRQAVQEALELPDEVPLTQLLMKMKNGSLLGGMGHYS